MQRHWGMKVLGQAHSSQLWHSEARVGGGRHGKEENGDRL